MRIDAYTHFFPKKFFDKLNEVAGDYKDMGKRVRSLPALFDLDVRKKIVDGHKDYQQILSYPQPPIEKFAKTPADIDEFCRIINDGFAELVRQGEGSFPGLGGARFACGAAMPASPKRSARSKSWRARRADLHQRRRQADRPAGIPAVLEKDERARQADLAASGARRRNAGLSSTRRNRCTRSGGPSAGPTRPPPPWLRLVYLQDHGQPSQPEDHHPPFRRHRADAGRPARAGQ